MASARRIRIGIDVGGTFTHAVALDATTFELIGKVKVPTTHTAAEGVAAGVVQSLQTLLAHCGLDPAAVEYIAYATTQATNALLEGDVARVGIIGMGRGLSVLLARRQTAVKPIPLTAGAGIPTVHRFVASDRLSPALLDDVLDDLRAHGAQVIVAAEAFSVDDPTHEQQVCEHAESRGLPATATHHVSNLHGLAMRTRTAVINASLIPGMLRTADLTEQAVRAAGIAAPILVMRSDGGVMSLAELRRRPLLTMLSGPAAGVAGALLHGGLSDAVFLEVGGTSTDVSVIHHGRCQMRSAEVGGHKLHARTLDVRTIGVAGGSLVQTRDGNIVAVGPRSTHIAGLPYLSFLPPGSWTFTAAAPQPLTAPQTLTIRAHPHAAHPDPDTARDTAVAAALTPTCAANCLALLPPADAAAVDPEHVRAGFATAASNSHIPDAGSLARSILHTAATSIAAVVSALVRDYHLDTNVLQLVGGGGAAAVLVPEVARVLGVPCTTVADADAISAIGVALALLRDTVERTVVDPNEAALACIRSEAHDRVLRMGAVPETIAVQIDVDARRHLLCATAEGATHIRTRPPGPAALSDDQRRDLVARSSRTPIAECACIIRAAGFEIWSARCASARKWLRPTESGQILRVLDAAGTIRWSSDQAVAHQSTVARAVRDLTELAAAHTRYSDAGARLPRCHVLLSGRIVDLSGLVTLQQVSEVLRVELRQYPAQTACVLLLST